MMKDKSPLKLEIRSGDKQAPASQPALALPLSLLPSPRLVTLFRQSTLHQSQSLDRGQHAWKRGWATGGSRCQLMDTVPVSDHYPTLTPSAEKQGRVPVMPHERHNEHVI